MSHIDKLYNVEGFRRLAARRLPDPVFDFMDGGADDERSLGRNSDAYAHYELLPRIFRDVSGIETKTDLMGCPVDWPVVLAPTGITRMFHPAAEPAVARAANRHGLIYSLSAMGTTSIETIGKLNLGPNVFQIYIFKDRGLTREFVSRSREAGFDGLVLTIDTPVAGNRERDKKHGLALPPSLTLRSFLSFALHPRWSLGALSGTKFELANLSHKLSGFSGGPMALFDYINQQFDPSLSWDDLEWLAGEWNGPLALKGVLSAADAKQAVASGATAIMASNHGGRQLDGAPAPIHQLIELRQQIGDNAELICDGGIRRGSDIVKALALGANAVSLGRPYLWGLAAGGEAGVNRVLQILREELERTLALLGVNNIRDLNPEYIKQIGASG